MQIKENHRLGWQLSKPRKQHMLEGRRETGTIVDCCLQCKVITAPREENSMEVPQRTKKETII